MTSHQATPEINPLDTGPQLIRSDPNTSMDQTALPASFPDNPTPSVVSRPTSIIIPPSFSQDSKPKRSPNSLKRTSSMTSMSSNTSTTVGNHPAHVVPPVNNSYSHDEDVRSSTGGYYHDNSSTLSFDDEHTNSDVGSLSSFAHHGGQHVLPMMVMDADEATAATGDLTIHTTLRKKRLLKKAPDAPKRFKSAYICFVTEKMEDVKQSLPVDTKVTEIMKTLAYMWKNLPPLERMEYERIAEEDKTR